MPIYKDFQVRLDRSYERAKQTAQGATMNKRAWLEQVKDLAVMRKLLEEGTLFIAESERRADVGLSNSQTLETLTIQQAEDTSSAKMISDNAGLFEHKDVGTVKQWLAEVDPLVFAEAWKRLPPARQAELTEARGMREAEDE